jgi:glycosyltransferase involved in cell wall biosynthesis
MAERSLGVLQVNLRDTQGGAAQIAWNLHRKFLARGLDSYMAVSRKFTDDDRVCLIQHEKYKPPIVRGIRNLGRKLEALSPTIRGTGHLGDLLISLTNLPRQIDLRRGHEDFNAPGTSHLLEMFPESLDVLQLHNLHKDWLSDGREFFDLRALPALNQKIPVVLTLHDAWMLSGHCAHSFDCDRWISGCGDCPDLSSYPAIRRDATAFNWKRKAEIYCQCHLHMITPSQWLMDKVERSMLSQAMVSSQVIPNGVDLSIFYPGNVERFALGLPVDAHVLLFTADGIRTNKFKDFETLRQSIALVAEHIPGIIFVALGEEGPSEQVGQAELRFVPYQKDPAFVAQYYRAADVYVHAARADNFPNTVLEALACGTPVVATRVGGIPEQIKEGVTGYLTSIGDPHAMASRIESLLTNRELRNRMGEAAALDASHRFDLNLQVERYLDYYCEIIKKQRVTSRE